MVCPLHPCLVGSPPPPSPPLPPSLLTLGRRQASVTVRRLYAAFSPLAAVRHFRADAAEAVHRLTTRPARGVSLLGVFVRPRYAADVGRLLVPTVVASVVVQLAANALAGGALAHLLVGGAGGAAAAGDMTAVAAMATTAVPSAVGSPPSVAAAVEGLGMSAGLVANAWLASTTLRFLNTLVTERDAVLFDSLRGSVAAVAPERMAEEEGGAGETSGGVQAATGNVRPVGTFCLCGGWGGEGRFAAIACCQGGGVRSVSARGGRTPPTAVGVERTTPDGVDARRITDIRWGLLWTVRVVCGRTRWRRCAPVRGGRARGEGGL